MTKTVQIIYNKVEADGEEIPRRELVPGINNLISFDRYRRGSAN